MKLALWIVALLLLALVAGVGLERSTESEERETFPPMGQLIAVDGVRRLNLHCRGAGPVTVLFEASGLGNSTAFDRVVDLVAGNAHACAYDRAGMGWSDPPDKPPSAAQSAADLSSLVERARLRPPYVLVAASAGGLDAELFARQHLGDVQALVFLDALDGTAVDALAKPLGELRRSACAASWLAKVGLLRVLDPLDLEDQAAALTYRASTTSAACGMLGNLNESRDQLAAAPPLPRDLPLVVLSHSEPRGLLPPGHEDEERRYEPLWNKLQEALAQRSTRGTHRIVPNAGHNIAVEQPRAVADAVLALLPTRPNAGAQPVSK